MLRKRIKGAVAHRGIAETAHIRNLLDPRRRPGWPYCPVDEGDLLYLLARAGSDHDALEVGFATGSTALYIASGLSAGKLFSIDYAQDQYEREGVALIRASGMDTKHELIEENSIAVLPRLYESGHRFNLIFLDGWKSFDHAWVDTFYCARMLLVGGYMVFDDTRMKAIRKCISILKKYYAFQAVDTYDLIGGPRQRMWHLLSTRSFLPPYVAVTKVKEIRETDAGRQYDFWKNF
jgi:predicted O-methyltransferase YrrM